MNSPSIATAIRLPPRRRCPARHTSGLYPCTGVSLCRRDLCAACGRVRWIGFTWMPRRVDGRDSTRLSARNPLELGHKYSQRQPRSYIGGGGAPEARMHPGPSAVANKDTGGPPSSTFDRDRAPLIPVLSRRAQHTEAGSAAHFTLLSSPSPPQTNMQSSGFQQPSLFSSTSGHHSQSNFRAWGGSSQAAPQTAPPLNDSLVQSRSQYQTGYLIVRAIQPIRSALDAKRVVSLPNRT